ncbi:MAG: hypothetical protein GY697_03360 [Desulfobacterales bacterium]|nr:hypothetical protein [Desulfobacterales bacterium]
MATSAGFYNAFQECFSSLPTDSPISETLALTIEGIPYTASFTLSEENLVEAVISDIVIAPA